jgi:hypothetical protein
MTKHSISKTAIASALGLLLLVPSEGCNQEKPKCATGRGAFIALYTYVSGPDSCKTRKGEKVGVQTYSARGVNNNPDLDHQSIAIQAESLGELVDNADAAGVKDADETHTPYSLGAFTTSEPTGDICTVPALTPALLSLPEIKEDPSNEVTAQPATNLEYTWSNVRVYVTPGAYGTQFLADVTRTENKDACVYTVQGMYPYVDCSTADPNDPTGKKMIADESACLPEATPPVHPTGSGINPDFPVHCDQDLLVCVLDGGGLPVLR